MPSVFDIALRRLVQQHPQQFLALIFGKRAPRFISTLDTSLPQSARVADSLLVVERKGKRFILIIELQAQRDGDFCPRLLDYTVRAHFREKLPVRAVAVYLLPQAEAAAPPYTIEHEGKRVVTFEFDVVRLWEVDFERSELQHPAVWALSVLGVQATPQHVAWAEAKIRAAPTTSENERLDWLSILGTLTERRFGLTFLSQALRKTMMDSPFLQRHIRKQVRTGIAKALEERLKALEECQAKALEERLKALEERQAKTLEEHRKTLEEHRKAIEERQVKALTGAVREFAIAQGVTWTKEMQKHVQQLDVPALEQLIRRVATSSGKKALTQLLSGAVSRKH